MEFFDEDTRPRFLFQSRPSPSSLTNQQYLHNKTPTNKPLLFFTITISSVSLLFSLLYLQSEPFKSLLLWASLSLLIGPFAPSHLTGGDISVGQGPIIQSLIEEDQNDVAANEKRRKRVKPVRSEGITANPIQITNASVRNEENKGFNGEKSNGVLNKEKKIGSSSKSENGAARYGEEEWTEEEIAILKKQMVKNPVGKVRRWEVITEAFNGRHKVNSVIKKAKELGEKRIDGDDDSFARFLKDRKPLDERIQGSIEGIESGSGGGGGWSAGEDLALLNALKAFPKDVAMRWEKIVAAVPGKTKAACMKRVAELKKDFRSSKAAAASGGGGAGESEN